MYPVSVKNEVMGMIAKSKIMRNWHLLFSSYQILYSYCHILYNGNKEGAFYEYEYYNEILTIFA